MLEVKFRRDSRQRLSSVFAAGHADAGVAGEDIVCAAASAILQAAELGLAAYAKLDTSHVTRADGEMAFHIVPAARERADVKAIVATAELAIEKLAWQFPAHVRFVREAEPDA
ncbi:MAG: hypothetical protein NVSMB64_31980 [Candidatus Velthaea sp.]